MKTTPLTLLCALAAFALLLSLWWWQGGDDAVPLPVETPPVATAAAPTAAEPANTSVPEPERSAAVDATAPTPKAEPTATFDILVVDAATQQPVADTEAFWSDATTERLVSQLPVLQRHDLWLDRERLAQQFGQRTRSDRDGRLRITADHRGCHVFVHAGGRFGELMVYGRSEPPAGGHRLLLARDEVLRVRVLDALGKPAERVPLGLRLRAPSGGEQPGLDDAVAHTDAAGVATFRHLQQVRMRRFGLAADTSTIDVVVDFVIPGLQSTATVVAHQDLPLQEPIELRLPPTGSLRLRYVVAGVPIQGLYTVRVDATASDEPSRHDRAVFEPVDGDGWALFRWLPAGVTLFAEPQGTSLVAVGSNEVSGLASGQRREHEVDLTRELVVLRGRLFGPGGEPMASSSVTVAHMSSGSSGGGMATTDAQGVFLFCLRGPRGQAALQLHRCDLTPHQRPELRLSLSPRELQVGINELGDLHFGGDPLVCSGRLEGYAPEMWEAQLFLEREGFDAESRTRSWRTLEQPQVGVGRDGVFEARGRVEPGRYRLRILARDHLPVAPVEFRLGQQDLVVPMQSGARFEVRCRLPAGADATQLVLDLVGGSAPPSPPKAADRGGSVPEHRRGFAHPLPDHGAGVRWHAVEPGTYTLRVALVGWGEPLLELPDVVVPSPSTADPRLSPLDLRDVAHLVTLQLVDASGNEIARDGFAIPFPQAQPKQWMGTLLHPGNNRVLLPKQPRRLLVANRGFRPAAVVVPADVDQVQVRLDPWPRLDLVLADGVALPEGCELHVTARAQRPQSDGTFGLTSGVGVLGDIEGLLQPSLDVAVLRRGVSSGTVVVGDGPSTLSVTMRRGERQWRMRSATPSEVSAGAPVTIALEAVEVAAAALGLAAQEKAK